MDLLGMSLLIGQGIGRWGNYANQEAFGTITGGNYGMMSEKVADYMAFNPEKFGLENVGNVYEYIEKNNVYVHPTFFYEFVWCMLGFLVLYIILKKFRKFSGQLFLCYGIWYGIGRAAIEGLRTDSLYIGTTGIRVSQALSLAIVAVCLAMLIIKLLKLRKNPQPIEGVDYFPKDAAKYFKEIKAEREEKENAKKKKVLKRVDDSDDEGEI
jgi:phosphatidylglycerol:prolipoprotein diacylglycerol transferase